MSEEPVTIQKPPARRRVVRSALWLLALLAVLLILLAAIRNVFIIEIPFHLAIGWLLHAVRSMPVLFAHGRSCLLPFGCLILAGILLHRFIRRTLASMKSPIVWRTKHTIASLLLLFSGCAAAIAMSGIVHQAAWLTDGELTEDISKKSDLAAAYGETRNLLMLLYDYHDSKGRYPNSLQELATEYQEPQHVLWLQGGPGAVAEPYVLLHPGAVTAVPADEPLVVSPIIQREGKMVVGYGDLTAKSVPAEQWKAIFQKLERKNIPPPRTK